MTTIPHLTLTGTRVLRDGALQSGDLSLADGGVYGILLADGPGDGTAQIVYFDDFTP